MNQSDIQTSNPYFPAIIRTSKIFLALGLIFWGAAFFPYRLYRWRIGVYP